MTLKAIKDKTKKKNINRVAMAVIAMMLMLPAAFTARAHEFRNEALTYDVTYKWGLVRKKAGTAQITLIKSGDKYYSKLTGKTEPWADRIYMVRDTLNGVMHHDLTPISYEKIAREGNSYKHDVVKFSYPSENCVNGQCTRVEYKDKKLKKDEKRELQAMGKTVDMLSAFYYMRTLPFEKWQKGHADKTTIFSGKRKETLSLKYQGTEEVKLDDRKFRCYHVTFIFTSEGGKKTSDDMDAWITADERRIPVKLQGNLAVGKVMCLYTGR